MIQYIVYTVCIVGIVDIVLTVYMYSYIYIYTDIAHTIEITCIVCIVYTVYTVSVV